MLKTTMITTMLLALACVAVASTLYVPTQYATIQDGINAAVNGDTVLVADGTYTGTGNTYISFMGKGIVVRSQNGPAATIVNCQGFGRGFTFNTGETAASVLDGFTITNGNAGGIFLYGSTPIIRHCIIHHNSMSGMTLSSASPTITQCTFFRNTASHGGAMNLSYGSAPVINSCIVVWNSSTG